MIEAGRYRKGLIGEMIRPLLDLVAMRHLSSEHQIIQVRDKIRTGVLAWFFARLTGRKFVYWMSFPFVTGFRMRAQDVGRSKGLLVWGANWVRAYFAHHVYYGFVAKRADHLFVQTEEMLRMMVAMGVPSEKMTAVPMGVDAQWLEMDRKAEALLRPAPLQGRRVLAYIGTMARSRSPDFLVRVLEGVRAKIPDAMLLLIGDAPNDDEQAWLRQVIAGSPCADAIHLTGWLALEEGQRWLAHAEIGFSQIPRGPLLDVGSPTKAIEYLAQGIPCIGNDNPDQRDVLIQSGAGLCVPMEEQAFVDAAVALLEHPEMAAAMSSRGPEWVRVHRIYPVLAGRVAAAYRQLVKESP
jgi:glycosyltransferase involved in cell wall biosynthesis